MMDLSNKDARALRTYKSKKWFSRQWELGFSVEKIARLAGIAVPTVERWKTIHELHVANPSQREYVSPHARATYANRVWLQRELDRRTAYEEIARKTGVSKSTIYIWVHRLRLTLSIRTYANKMWMADCVGCGLRNSEIAALADCNTSTILKWQGRFGITANSPKKSGPRFAAEQKRFGEWLRPRLREFPLDRRDVLVLKRRHGINGRVRTLEEVHLELGVTRQCIQQIHRRALRKVVAFVGTKALKDFPKIAALPPYNFEHAIKSAPT